MQRVSHKLQLCPEEYLPIVEGAIDGALRIYEQEKEPVCVSDYRVMDFT